MFSALVPLLLAAAPITVDKAAHRVTFTAHATEVTAGTTVEFAFVGPDSDRAYEAMFVTDASVSEIARAFEQAGIPCGRAITQSGCRFWPVGKHLDLSPAIWDFVQVKEDSDRHPILYTGGTRDAAGLPAADTNMPKSVMSFYSLDQSLVLQDDAIDQSAVYGRYASNGKAEKGRTYRFTFAWDGKNGSESRTLKLEPGKIKAALSSLKDASTDLDVLPVFSPDLTLAEAQSAANALAIVDSRKIKINGFAEGQFFYRGFLPDEAWRIRSKRLTQPLEARISASNVTYTVIHENWNVEGMDPELTPKDVSQDEACTTFKGNTCLFYVGRQEKLSRIYALMKKMPRSIVNWYVFID